MYGAPRKHTPLTQQQLDYLALTYIRTSQLGKEDFLACGLGRKINHDERDMIFRRVESLGTELLKRYIRPNPEVDYKEYR